MRLFASDVVVAIIAAVVTVIYLNIFPARLRLNLHTEAHTVCRIIAVDSGLERDVTGDENIPPSEKRNHALRSVSLSASLSLSFRARLLAQVLRGGFTNHA